MYNFDKALQRIGWRFTSKKPFLPNQQDIDSINCILQWINNQKKEDLKKNHLFAKLFIYNLNQIIRDYDTDVLNDFAQKELSRLLNIPLEAYYRAFKQELDNVQVNKIVAAHKLGKEVTEADLKEKYDIKYVENQLNHMITEALNRFK